MNMTIKTISLAGAPDRDYLWRYVRRELLDGIEPGLNDALRLEFPEMQGQLSDLDRQTEFRLINLLSTNLDEENNPN
jgi:hypothetical protein